MNLMNYYNRFYWFINVYVYSIFTINDAGERLKADLILLEEV